MSTTRHTTHQPPPALTTTQQPQPAPHLPPPPDDNEKYAYIHRNLPYLTTRQQGMRLGALAAFILMTITACGITNSFHEPAPPSPSRQSLLAYPPPGGAPQLGIAVVWYYDGQDTTSEIAAKANTTFQYIRRLGGNATSISFPFYMLNSHSSYVYASTATPSPAQLAIVIRIAENYGLRVTVRPLLDEAVFLPSGWRGSIEPKSRHQWFASYSAFLRPYLIMAQATGAKQFEIGIELNSQVTALRWKLLVARARVLYHGILGYSNNWDFFQKGELGPRSVDSQGLDAYFPVSLNDKASVQQIAAAWNKWFRVVPPDVDLSKVVITEIGIPAQAGAYREPFNWHRKLPIDPKIQRRWFAAACDVMRQRHMSGIYYWLLDFNKPPGSLNPSASTPESFVGRGSTAIKACFRR